MSRKRSRYAKLLQELKTTEGNPTTGSRLEKFLDYLTGKNKSTIVNKPPENSLKRYNLAIYPFGIEPEGTEAADRYKVTITAYSYQGMKDVGLAITDLGASFIVGGEKDNADFFPALIKPSVISTAYVGNENQVSAITGDTYNYEPTRTYSMPFGRTVAAPDATTGVATGNLAASDEVDVSRYLKTKIQTGDESANIKSVGYDPELFKPGGGASDATTDADIPTLTLN